jgi:carboxylate-amine ligase
LQKDFAHTYTFGIEEEFLIVDPRTRHALSRVPKHVVKSCRSRFGERVTYELKQAQIETVSPVFNAAEEALPELLGLRRGVADVLEAHGLALMAAGTHPISRWQNLRATEKPRYARFIEQFQMIGRRDTMCGMHVHVAVPAGVDRVQLMNRLLPRLPLFLALSTSSPFWGRHLSGLFSYRSVAYEEWPRAGIPDFFTDEAEYADFADVLTRNGAIGDASEFWWSIRPSLRYPTLELRAADSCTRVQDSVALAVLFRALVRHHVLHPHLGATHSNMTRRLIDENRWRAARYGIQAQFIDEASRSSASVSEVLEQLLADLQPHLEPAEMDAIRPLRSVLALGTSAHVQTSLYATQREAGASHIEALRGVVDWLIQTTRAESQGTTA